MHCSLYKGNLSLREKGTVLYSTMTVDLSLQHRSFRPSIRVDYLLSCPITDSVS